MSSCRREEQALGQSWEHALIPAYSSGAVDRDGYWQLVKIVEPRLGAE